MKELIFPILMAVVMLSALAAYVTLEVHCWNIPIAERAGMCALLH